MRCQLTKFDVTYEGAFRVPAFALATKSAQTLQSLAETLHPRYTVTPSEARAVGGTALSDVRLQLTLFNGNGLIELSVDKVSATFTNAVGTPDVHVIKDCISLCLDGIGKTLPDVALKQQTVRLIMVLDLKEEGVTAADYINSLSTDKIRFAAEPLNGAQLHYPIKLELHRPDEHWQTTFELTRAYDSQTPQRVFLFFNTYYDEGTAYASVDDKDAHLSQLLLGFFQAVGLEPPSESE